jgi:hypothetical protein
MPAEKPQGDPHQTGRTSTITVSRLAQGEGYLERELAKDNIAVRWVQTGLSSQQASNACSFLNAGAIDFSARPRSAALSRQDPTATRSSSVYSLFTRPEWTAFGDG